MKNFLYGIVGVVAIIFAWEIGIVEFVLRGVGDICYWLADFGRPGVF